MIIDQNMLNSLTEQAKASPRLRMNFDLRNTPEDNSQRMLNAIEPGSPMPIHRHRNTSETVVIVRGRLVEDLYDETGTRIVESVEMSMEGPCLPLPSRLDNGIRFAPWNPEQLS